ncbi:MAG: hypothetical protein ABGX12_04875 [Desulfurobacteriaceae bacterium]
MRKFLIPFTALMLLSGCVTMQTSEKQPALSQQVVKLQLLGDAVPVYPGFKVVPSKSFIYESGNIKVGRVEFVGSASVKDIVSYYKNTLPERGWEPVAVRVYGNSAQLTYVTPEQFLQISVNKGFSETRIVIELGPRGEVGQELTIPRE